MNISSRTPLSILLIVYVYLLDVSVQRRLQSTIIVKNGDEVIGPAIELSKNILKDGEELEWTCRENLNIEANSLDKKQGSGWQVIAGRESLNTDTGAGSIHVCSEDFSCSVITGKISWSRDKGGTYRCVAYPDQQFTVFWINPKLLVPSSSDYEQGGNVNLFCELPLSPMDVNVNGLVNLEWQRLSKTYGNSWKTVNEDGSLRIVTPSTGSRFELKISEFSAVNHGGTFRCVANVDGYGSIKSKEFDVHSEATAELINDKRRSNFEFGLGEKIEIKCLVDSYPYPSDIKLQIGGRDVNSVPEWEAETDMLAAENGKFYSKVTINNVTASLNDSLVMCAAFRNGKREGLNQQLIVVRDEPPPDQDPDGTYTGVGKPRSEPQKAWVVAIYVIIPIVIILIIVVVLVWRCRRSDDEGYEPGKTDEEDP